MMNQKRRKYEKPEILAVSVPQHTQLLTTSNVNASMDGVFQEIPL